MLRRLKPITFALFMTAVLSTLSLAANQSGIQKIIALTFDDGPKPYVLLGGKSGSGIASASLLRLLQRENAKATFFVMGWRLAKSADRRCSSVDGGVCRDAVIEAHRQGEEIENHTYGHGDFRQMEKRFGDDWIMADIEKGSVIIQNVVGQRPRFLRPPDWDIWPEMQKRIETKGYFVMSRSSAYPPALRDVDSMDYFCVGRSLPKCPKPSDYDYVIRQIELRERKGIKSHILAFHELPQTVELLSRLLPKLHKKGYRFVTLQEYMKAVGPAR